MHRAEDRTTFVYLGALLSWYPQNLSRIISSMCVVPGPSDLSVALVLRLCTVGDRLYSYLLTVCQFRLHFELKCNLKRLYQLTGYNNATYAHADFGVFCHYWLSIISSRLLRLDTCSRYYIFRKWVRLSVSSGHCMTDTNPTGQKFTEMQLALS